MTLFWGGEARQSPSVDCEDGTTDFRTVRYLGMYEEITSDPAGPGMGPKVMDQGFNFWGDGIDPFVRSDVARGDLEFGSVENNGVTMSRSITQTHMELRLTERLISKLSAPLPMAAVIRMIDEYIIDCQTTSTQRTSKESMQQH